MSLRIAYDERAIDQAAGFLRDDPAGVREMLGAIDRLADEPRLAGSFPYGSPDLRRLRAGRYRVLYEITGDVLSVRNIARVARQPPCLHTWQRPHREADRAGQPGGEVGAGQRRGDSDHVGPAVAVPAGLVAVTE